MGIRTGTLRIDSNHFFNSAWNKKATEKIAKPTTASQFVHDRSASEL
jgi:hypothetical protein